MLQKKTKFCALRPRAFVATLLVALVAALAPASGPVSPFAAGPALAAQGEASTAERAKKKRRCKVVRKNANGKRVVKKRACKKKPLALPVPQPSSPDVPVATPTPVLPGAPDGPDAPGEPEAPDDPDYPGPPASPYERVNLIPNGTFEAPEKPTSCFVASGNEGSFTASEADPIAGAKSLAVTLTGNGVGVCEHEYGWEEGPKVKELELEGKLRLNTPAGPLNVCAVAYFDANKSDRKACRGIPAGTSGVVDVQLKLDTEEKKLQRVFFWLAAGNNPIQATLDDAHLYAEVLKGSEGGGGDGDGGGDGGGGGSTAGRYAAIVSPTAGETFSSPLDLRLVGIGYDPNVDINEPTTGHGGNAAKVEFLLDGQPIFEQDGTDAEYYVFKGFAQDLDVAPGEHTLRVRATYADSQVKESPPVTITVEDPAYAETIELQGDVVLGAGQSYELLGAPNARIKLDANGHRIRAGGTSGDITLRHVDVFELGSNSAGSVPGMDVTATGTTGSVTIENSRFDSSNPVHLRLNGSATATVENNTFRSNMRMPIGQQPASDDFSPTAPVIEIAGTSSAPKTFAGNNVAAAPVRFENVSRWTIGGPTDADSNVLIGARTAFEVIDSDQITVEGNFVNHDYYGGWSQGQLLELHGTSPISVKHNVLLDSSWPVRGIADEFAYNLVAEAGHYWMVPGDDAYVHHNLFVGGDNDVGGITGFYNVSARIENNTFDGLRGHLARRAIKWEEGETTLRSNAFLNFPTAMIGIVDREGGTVEADYNGFFNPELVNYTDGSTPANDLAGGASTNPLFAGPAPTESFEGDKVAVWNRELTVSEILSAYRARYTPTLGSPYIDAGDPAGGAGNDIGAIGVGIGNALDRFGSFAQPGWVPPPTPEP